MLNRVWLKFDLGRITQLGLSLQDCVPSVIFRIGLVFGAKIGDALHNDCWVIAASKGAFCVGPILLGLAPVLRREFASGFTLEPARSFLGIFLKLEVACVMNCVRLVMSLYDEFR